MSEGPTLPLLRMELMPVLRRLPAYSRLAWALVRDRRIKRRHRILLLGGIGYLLSPIDLIPGFIPVLAHLAASDLSREILNADLSRVNRSGRLVTRAAFRTGRSLAVGAGRTLWRLGRQVLNR